jgi:hypothetical protein
LSLPYRDAARVVEARRKLGIETCGGRIERAVAALRDPAVHSDDVWAALRIGIAFQPADAKWAKHGKRATGYMQRLRELCPLGESPVLGLTIHQSKGLEWNRVLLLNGELNTNPSWRNRLEQKWEDHRSVHVGLTHARSNLRVIPIPQSRFSPRTKIEWIPTT